MRLLPLLLCLIGFAWPSRGAVADTQPNVVVIVTDDQGTGDAGCYGATDLQTPAMDALAAEGVKFTQFYAAAPVCSPSRAALLTGKVPQRAGLTGNAGSEPGVRGMPSEQTTMAEVFGDAGYFTAHVGKWHLGYRPETMPLGQGFARSFGFMGGCIDNYSHFFYWNGPNRHDLFRDGEEVWHDGEFFGDLVVTEAAEAMDAAGNRPFFMYVALNLPHYPLQGTAKWRDTYADLPSPRDKYAAAVSTVDEQIGQIVAALDERGLREKTIVVFMSDHGHSVEERTFGGGGSAGPYRGAKFSLFEGGIRVPAILSWPGHLEPGVRDQMAVAVDWLPTVAELAGVERPDDLDGQSLVPLLNDETSPEPHDAFFWQSGGNRWAVRAGTWKLLHEPIDPTTSQPVETVDGLYLVDLAADPGERHNLAAQHPDVTERLRLLHEEWAERGHRVENVAD